MTLPITRSNEFERGSVKRVEWLDSFANKLQEKMADPKTAVEVARLRSQKANMLETIQSIVSGKSSASLVENKVQEFQERTGLSSYLKRISAQVQGTSFADLNPELKKDITNYVHNLVETHHGNIHIPAIIESVSSIFKHQGLTETQVSDPEFAKLINQELISHKKENPSIKEDQRHLGKGLAISEEDVDQVDDFLGGAMFGSD